MWCRKLLNGLRHGLRCIPGFMASPCLHAENSNSRQRNAPHSLDFNHETSAWISKTNLVKPSSGRRPICTFCLAETKRKAQRTKEIWVSFPWFWVGNISWDVFVWALLKIILSNNWPLAVQRRNGRNWPSPFDYKRKIVLRAWRILGLN